MLDLAHVYTQLPLDVESRKLTTNNTGNGLYHYNHIHFGIAVALAIFLRTMENLLQGMPNVVVYIDNILVTGPTEERHLNNLQALLCQLVKVSLYSKHHKCAYITKTLEYHGHTISPEGLRLNSMKVEAATAAPAPTDIPQLRSFLGLIIIYGKFLPNTTSVLPPLYKFLIKEVE